MTDKLSKTKRLLFVIAVMFSNVAIMGDSPLYTISNELYNAWPNSSALVSFALSAPPLIMILAAFLAPAILKKISKKKLLIVGCVLFTVGSICSVLIPTAAWFAGMRVLVGLGQGFIQVTAIALMTEVFFEESVRNKYMGFYNASTGVIGIIYNYFAGHWAVADFTHAFRVYYLSIPMLIMAILFIPELIGEEKRAAVEEKAAETAAAGGKKEGLGAKYIIYSACLLIYYAVAMIVAYFTSVYIAEKGLGNSVLVGYISIVGQITSFVTSVLFAPLMKLLKKWALSCGVILLVVEYCLFQFIPNVPMLIIARIIQMFSFGLIYTYHMSVVPAYAPKSRQNTAISWVTIIYGLGTFLSTYLATFCMGLFDGTFSSSIVAYIAIMAVLAVITVVLALREKNQVTE